MKSISPILIIAFFVLPPQFIAANSQTTQLEGMASEENESVWSWQAQPKGLIWRSYQAGLKQSRLASVFGYQFDLDYIWAATVGLRVGVVRFGTQNDSQPEGFQLDVEGAAFPELTPRDWDLRAVDFRCGFLATYAYRRMHYKLGMYHLSSHIGDRFQLKNPDFKRVEYSRNAITAGAGYNILENFRIYAELDWGFDLSGKTQPWQFQFGAEYSREFHTMFGGSPFAALNVHLREEVGFGGVFVIQAGWLWQNSDTGTRIRIGIQYVTGKNEQYQFYDAYAQQIGFGTWFDF